MDVSSTTAVAPRSTAPERAQSVWGADGFGFDDLLDVVNPLQHLPGVGQVYRHLTGDELGMLPRIAGGLLFGGPLGAAGAMVTAGVEAGTGRTPGEHVLAALQGEGAATAPPPPTRVARAYAPPAPARPTPHAPAPEPGAAADAPPGAPPGAEATREAQASPPWTPPISAASERLLAELARGGERSAKTAG
jgi:hypothetical protein